MSCSSVSAIRPSRARPCRAVRSLRLRPQAEPDLSGLRTPHHRRRRHGPRGRPGRRPRRRRPPRPHRRGTGRAQREDLLEPSLTARAPRLGRARPGKPPFVRVGLGRPFLIPLAPDSPDTVWKTGADLACRSFDTPRRIPPDSRTHHWDFVATRPYAQGVTQHSPGSPKAHPGSRTRATPVPRRGSTAFPGCAARPWARVCNAVGVGIVGGGGAFPGCAARPWAVLWNAVGVRYSVETWWC